MYVCVCVIILIFYLTGSNKLLDALFNSSFMERCILAVCRARRWPCWSLGIAMRSSYLMVDIAKRLNNNKKKKTTTRNTKCSRSVAGHFSWSIRHQQRATNDKCIRVCVDNVFTEAVGLAFFFFLVQRAIRHVS